MAGSSLEQSRTGNYLDHREGECEAPVGVILLRRFSKIIFVGQGDCSDQLSTMA